jgi:hypothetical protein
MSFLTDKELEYLLRQSFWSMAASIGCRASTGTCSGYIQSEWSPGE